MPRLPRRRLVFRIYADSTELPENPKPPLWHETYALRLLGGV